MDKIAQIIADVISNIDNEAVISESKKKVQLLTSQFPLYDELDGIS